MKLTIEGLRKVFRCRIFVMKGVVIPRFHCTFIFVHLCQIMWEAVNGGVLLMFMGP